MTLEQLRVFVEVAERLHVTRAASVLNMSQPAPSAVLQALETWLGTALFDRGSPADRADRGWADSKP